RGKHVGFSQRTRLGVIVRRWPRAIGRRKQHRCRPSRCGSLYGTLFECVARMCTYILVYFSRLKGLGGDSALIALGLTPPTNSAGQRSALISQRLGWRRLRPPQPDEPQSEALSPMNARRGGGEARGDM